MRNPSKACRINARSARSIWGQLPPTTVESLKLLTISLALSVVAGDLQLLENRWYVTHSGLLRIAQRRRCSGIKTIIEDRLSDPLPNRWVFKATVYPRASSKGFVGYGDADPSNVSSLMHGAEMRVAETRAVNRALRKAYGVGLCSVEELGSLSSKCGSASDHASTTNHSTKRFQQWPATLTGSTPSADLPVQSRSHSR